MKYCIASPLYYFEGPGSNGEPNLFTKVHSKVILGVLGDKIYYLTPVSLEVLTLRFPLN